MTNHPRKGDQAMKERRELAPGALTAPLPPVMVTVGEGEERNIITIGWTGILATHPPKTYISVRPTRHSYGLLKKYGELVIDLPTAALARTVDSVGIYTRARVDKFARTGLTPKSSNAVGAPTIGECPIAIECKVTEIIPMGSHDVFIADIVSVSCDEDILDAEGRMCFDRAGLLAYAHGEYFALGRKLGRFGFSTDKGQKSGTRVKKSDSSGRNTASGEKKSDDGIEKAVSASDEGSGKDTNCGTRVAKAARQGNPKAGSGARSRRGSKGSRSVTKAKQGKR